MNIFQNGLHKFFKLAYNLDMYNSLKEGHHKVNELTQKLYENRLNKESAEERSAMLMNSAWNIMAKGMIEAYKITIRKRIS